MKQKILALLLFSITLSSCNENLKDNLLGEFKFKQDKKSSIKITKEGINYYLQSRKNNDWGNQKKLEEVNKNEYNKLFGSNWKNYVEIGLKRDNFSIFKVKKGYRYKNHTYKTGYFIFYLVSADVYKLK